MIWTTQRARAIQNFFALTFQVYTHVHALRKTAIKTAVVFDLPPEVLNPFCAAPQLGQMTAAATRPLPKLAQNLV